MRYFLAFITLLSFFSNTALAANAWVAVEVRASSQFFTASNSSDLDISGAGVDLTMQLWIKPTNILNGAGYGLITHRGANGYALGINGNPTPEANTIFVNINTGGASFNWNNNIILDKWNHVTTVYRSGAGAVDWYVNGIFIQTITGLPTAITSNTSTLCVGTDGVACAAGDIMNGKIDEVRIWNRALTPSEIKTNWNQELLGNNSGLVAYYKFTMNNPLADSSTWGAGADNLTNNNSTPFSSADTPFSDFPQDIVLRENKLHLV